MKLPEYEDKLSIFNHARGSGQKYKALRLTLDLTQFKTSLEVDRFAGRRSIRKGGFNAFASSRSSSFGSFSVSIFSALVQHLPVRSCLCF